MKLKHAIPFLAIAIVLCATLFFPVSTVSADNVTVIVDQEIIIQAPPPPTPPPPPPPPPAPRYTDPCYYNCNTCYNCGISCYYTGCPPC
ncbi:MAG TPA: hypothetical protein VJ488_05395, partial [Dehalococcoidia bacterium]|nr:hypothetical protein [Dehalococcoidia bacterium]